MRHYVGFHPPLPSIGTSFANVYRQRSTDIIHRSSVPAPSLRLLVSNIKLLQPFSPLLLPFFVAESVAGAITQFILQNHAAITRLVPGR
jgi:hypothetical protein